MPRLFSVLLILVGGALVAPASPVASQESPPPPQTTQGPDTTTLVFEREVFVYPTYQRRNPFTPLLTGDEAGPRFEELRLIGVLFSSDPAKSVALFGPRVASEGPMQTYRVRRGDTLGNIRVLEIQRSRVVVEVVEFGLTEQRIMELQRPGQGGLS
jgi:hypothetical protein